MENYFDLEIEYNGRLVEIKVQILSKELPKIIYVVWPKDDELKKYFENIIQFNFHINSKLNKVENILEIFNYVIYDYKKEENQIKDIEFEFGVWKSLLAYNL
jgi:hypothetical protein